MISKKHLLAINELNISESIGKMNDSQLVAYNKNLEEFVDEYPAYEAELKRAFATKDYTAFSHTVLRLRNSLSLLCADDLTQSCLKLLNDIKTGRYEVTEAYFSYFLTALSSLSISIQVAWQKGEQEEISAEPVPAPVAGSNLNKVKTILAVDDMSMILSSLKSALQGTQYKFVGASSAAAALEYIKNHSPDLFLLDIEMPEMDGYELAARIRKSGQTAPIVFLTGNSSKEYVLKAIRAGAADFIVKPVSREQVLGKIIKYTL